MKHNVYAVYDAAAAAYLPPFCSQRDGAAIRAFSDAVNSSGHQFSQHAKDFTLFHLGTYDDGLGTFECRSPAPHAIATALGCIVPKFPDRNQLDLIDNPPAYAPAPKANGAGKEVNE